MFTVDVKQQCNNARQRIQAEDSLETSSLIFLMFQENPLLSARQRIHLKHQVLFSLKDKSKKLKCRLLQFLFGALRVITSYCSYARPAQPNLVR